MKKDSTICGCSKEEGEEVSKARACEHILIMQALYGREKRFEGGQGTLEGMLSFASETDSFRMPSTGFLPRLGLHRLVAVLARWHSGKTEGSSDRTSSRYGTGLYNCLKSPDCLFRKALPRGLSQGQ